MGCSVALCECGCGEPAPLSDRNDTKRGYVKGAPLRFICGHQRRGRGLVGQPGERYGRLTIVREAHAVRSAGKRVRMVLCVCDCGSEKVVRLASLRGGLTKSCGCLEEERIEAAHVGLGDRFGHLVVAEFLPLRVFRSARMPQVRCVCDCGARTDVLVPHLRSGATRSCGCESADKPKHGHARKAAGRTRTYISWLAMRGRCNNPADPGYDLYGGRGIKVCDRWNTDFALFLADMGERPPGMSIDRIDNERGYEPANCRWADAVTQRRNRRDYLSVA